MVVFCIYTELCNHHHLCLVPELSITSKETPFPPAVTPHSLPSPGTHASFLSLWISVSWTFHRNGVIQCVVFCVWYVTECDVLKVHPHYGLGQSLVPVHGWVMFWCVDRPPSADPVPPWTGHAVLAHSSVDSHLGRFHFVATQCAALNICAVCVDVCVPSRVCAWVCVAASRVASSPVGHAWLPGRQGLFPELLWRLPPAASQGRPQPPLGWVWPELVPVGLRRSWSYHPTQTHGPLSLSSPACGPDLAL